MIGRSVVAVTFATWNERTLPPRSTNENTASFFGVLPFRFLAFAAYICLVGFYKLAFATERGWYFVVLCEPDTVRHEPRAAVCNAEHPMELMRAHAFLAGVHQPESQKPFVHRNVRPLHNRPDAHGELLTALRAPVPTRSHGLAAERRDGFDQAAMRAGRTVRPLDSLENDPCGFIVVVAGMGK